MQGHGKDDDWDGAMNLGSIEVSGVPEIVPIRMADGHYEESVPIRLAEGYQNEGVSAKLSIRSFMRYPVVSWTMASGSP